MDSFHKPSALSFDGNVSENWRRFKQQFDIYVTASGSEKKDDVVKIADTNVNFKLDSGADCNVISKSLLARLPVGPKQTRQCKAKLKVYDGRLITPSGKISLTCEYKGKFTALDFILTEQDLPSVLGLKPFLDLGLIKRIYHLQKENLESEYADVFEGLGEIKGVQHKIQIDPNATKVVHPPRRAPVALREPLKEEL